MTTEPPRARGAGPLSATAERAFSWASYLGSAALFGLALWSVTFGARVNLGALKSPSRIDAHLDAMEAMMLGTVVVALLLSALVSSWRKLLLERGTRLLGAVSGLALVLRVVSGPTTMIPAAFLAVCAALSIGVLVGERCAGFVSRRALSFERASVYLPTALAVVVYVVWSVTRHESFGSGSWDMGCYNHNIFILGFGKPQISSVLGDAHFWGGTNHFMPVLYLFAPLAWLGVDWLLLVAQALVVACATFPLAALARRGGLGPFAVLGLNLAYLFAVGTQSMINFDFHEIAPVPLGLFLAILGFDTNRRWLAYLGLVLVFACKESSILYAGAVGGWLLLTRPGRRLEGAAIAVVCLASFWFVVGWMQPHFLEEHSKGMIHLARFGAFGDSLGEGVANMARHPGKVLTALVSPEQKATTLLITFGGFGFLPFLSPGALWLALPNLVERFLSDKREMWGLHYHYSLVLVSICAYASLRGYERVAGFLAARSESGSGALRRLSAPGVLDVSFGLFLVLSTLGSFAASPSGIELGTLHKPYFSTAEGVAINNRALALIPDDAPVVAQNHFLPHLALRQFIWQPYEKFLPRADYIVLNPLEGPWPHDKRYVVRLVKRLLDDERWTLIFSEGTTVVFQKPGASDAAAVAPSDALLEALGR